MLNLLTISMIISKKICIIEWILRFGNDPTLICGIERFSLRREFQLVRMATIRIMGCVRRNTPTFKHRITHHLESNWWQTDRFQRTLL